MILIGRADQREIVFVGDREDDPPVCALKEVALVVVVEPLRVTIWLPRTSRTLPWPRVRGSVADDVSDPRAAGIDQRSGARTVWLGTAVFRSQSDLPVVVGRVRRGSLRCGA